MALRCPGCAESMAPETSGESEVDVCTSCQGIWVDWFDGEVRNVARTVIAGDVARGSQPPPQRSPLRNEALATGACPRCMRQLTTERFEVCGAGASTPTGAELLRCEECAGVFVARASAELLSSMPAHDETPPSSAGAGVLDPLPWQKLVAVLKRLVGSR